MGATRDERRRGGVLVALSVAVMLTGAALTLALCGCSSGGGSLEGTSWTLASWSDASSLAGVTITAGFEDGKIAGRSAVNQYGGPFTAGGDGSLKLGPIASTNMAGPPAAMHAEEVYFRLLDAVTTYNVDGGKLVLSDSAGSALLTYTRSSQ